MLEMLKQIDLGIALLALAIFFWAWWKGRMIKELLKEWRSEDQKREERWQEEQKKRDEERRRFFDNFDKRHVEYQKVIMESLTKISENLARR